MRLRELFLFDSVVIPEMIDGKPTRNSNGQHIHQTIPGIKKFWKWFGNSTSVDAEGRPIVFYHATNNDFAKFDISKGYGVAGQGVYLTKVKPHDDKYGTFVMPLYVKMENVKDFSAGDKKINKYALDHGMDALFDLNSFQQMKEWAVNFRQNMISAGFDSCIIKGENNQNYYVSYHPNHVKSALGNKGAFSKSSNITESISPDTIWYHASDVPDIIDFDDTKLKNEKFGHFFTDDPETVKGIYGEHVYARRLEVTNPYTISQDKWNSIRDAHARDAGYFKQLRDKIINAGHDSLLVKTRNIQLGRFDIRDPNIMVVFDTSKIKPVPDNITESFITEETIEKQLANYEKQLAYMNKYGKLPRTAPPEYTNDERYKYYYHVEDKIEELQKQLKGQEERRSSHVPHKLFNNPKFRAWFKGSKVVDEMGDPLPVYHGSNADIKEFNHAFNASSSGNAQYGAGFYFTTSPHVASGYADYAKDTPVVYQVFLKIKKPLLSSKKYRLSRDQIKRFIVSAPNWQETLNDFEDIETYGLSKCLSEVISNLYEYQNDTLLETLFQINNDWYKNHDQEFVTSVTNILGYDGIQVNLEGTVHWIAFYPWQIKSAVGNVGKYSKTSGNITEAVGGRPDTNSVGKPIARTPESINNFWNWFGDSKIVDSQGRPLVMYHGTSADFNTFKRSKSDIGMHFGTIGQADDRVKFNIKRGRFSSGMNTLPVYLRIIRPLRLPDAGAWDVDNMRYELKKLFPHKTGTIGQLRTSKQISDFIASMGYDGIIYKNTSEIKGAQSYQDAVDHARDALSAVFPKNNSFNKVEQQTPEYQAWVKAMNDLENHEEQNAEDSYIIFDNTQVKSAIGNTGQFNAKSGNITEAVENDDSRLARAEQMGFDTNTEWWHGSFSNFKEFDPKRSGSSSFHFSSKRDFADDYARTKSQDMEMDEDIVTRSFYLPSKLFDFRNPEHIEQLRKILPKEIGITGRYGWAAWGGETMIPKAELIEAIQGIQLPYTGIDDAQKEKIRNGAEYFNREGSNEKVINYDSINDVVEWVPGWEYQTIQGIKNNIQWAIQMYGEDDFRVRQYQLELKNKESKIRVKKTELSPEKHDGFDNWHLMEAPELKPYFKRLKFEGALMQERKSLNAVIFDSNRIRLTTAKFDPTMIKSSDITA